jgi:hypothetical protein
MPEIAFDPYLDTAVSTPPSAPPVNVPNARAVVNSSAVGARPSSIKSLA